jgi:hypothetical protein
MKQSQSETFRRREREREEELSKLEKIKYISCAYCETLEVEFLVTKANLYYFIFSPYIFGEARGNMGGVGFDFIPFACTDVPIYLSKRKVASSASF